MSQQPPLNPGARRPGVHGLVHAQPAPAAVGVHGASMVKSPGSRGGKFYKTASGAIRYGSPPAGKAAGSASKAPAGGGNAVSAGGGMRAGLKVNDKGGGYVVGKTSSGKVVHEDSHKRHNSTWTSKDHTEAANIHSKVVAKVAESHGGGYTGGSEAVMKAHIAANDHHSKMAHETSSFGGGGSSGGGKAPAAAKKAAANVDHLPGVKKHATALAGAKGELSKAREGLKSKDKATVAKSRAKVADAQDRIQKHAENLRSARSVNRKDMAGQSKPSAGAMAAANSVHRDRLKKAYAMRKAAQAEHKGAEHNAGREAAKKKMAEAQSHIDIHKKAIGNINAQKASTAGQRKPRMSSSDSKQVAAGQTQTGKAIHANSASGPKAYKKLEGKSDAQAGSMVRKSFKHYSAEDHRDAAKKHFDLANQSQYSSAHGAHEFAKASRLAAHAHHEAAYQLATGKGKNGG